MNWKRVLPVGGVALVALAAIMWSGDVVRSAPPGDDQKVVVHLSNYTGDLHAAFMALKLANAMQEGGAEVSLFLDLEGVRLADSRAPLNVMWGTAHQPLSKHYEAFVEGGGKVILCPHCAAAVGIEEANVRDGAMIGIPEEQTIPNMLLAADKILDF
jgi:predicted peroxiredoxin